MRDENSPRELEQLARDFHVFRRAVCLHDGGQELDHAHNLLEDMIITDAVEERSHDW